MAITATASLSVTSKGVTKSKGKTSANISQAVERDAWFRQLVGVTPENLAIPTDLGTAGECIIENLSNTATVSLVVVTNENTEVTTIQPGRMNHYTFSSTYTPQVVSNVANTEIDVLVASA